MALDPNIILHASDAFNRLPNYGQVMEQRAAIQAHQSATAEREAAIAQQQQDRARAEETRGNRIKIGQIAATGDYGAARKGAMANGDLELVKHLDGMQEEDRKRALQLSRDTAPLLLSLRDVPVEQRPAALQQIAPQLIAAGFKPENIPQLASDLSDAALDRVENSAMTLAEYQASRKPVNLGSYDTLVDPRTGKTIAQGQQPTKYQLDPETGQVVQIGGPGVGGGGQPSAAGADTVYGNGKYASPPAQLSTMPMGAVSSFQKNQLIPATRGKVGAGPNEGTGAVGTYQITYGTLKRYGPKVFGAGWQNVPFSAENQDKLGRAIYEDAKNGDLHTVWAGMPSNAPGAYSNVPWEEARGKIAQVESGGSAPVRNGKLSAGYRWTDKSHSAQEPIPGGAADKGAQLPRVPASVMDKYITNRSAVRMFSDAEAAVKAYPGAVGAQNYVVPNPLSQRTDPKGVDARALIANIGSQIIHDRSGAAVTVSEYPRLKPFIPLITDTPATVQKKLAALKREVEKMNQELVEGYSNDAGDSQLNKVGGTAPRIKNAEDYARLPSGATFIDPNGVKRRKP